MRLSNLNDLQLQATADSMRQIASKLVDSAALEELIDRRAAMSPMRLAEMTFAYERASGVIESSCLTVEVPGDDYTWYDLATATEDLDDEIAYLDSRRLLIRSGSNLVAICDEGEPLGEGVRKHISKLHVCEMCGSVGRRNMPTPYSEAGRQLRQLILAQAKHEGDRTAVTHP